jgi:hypothetical protein
MNRAPVVWYSKKQNHARLEHFLVGDCRSQERNRAPQVTKVQTTDATWTSRLFCDNEAVVINFLTPESTIKKKNHSIAYHHNREAASGTVRIAKENSDTNLADLFTKLLSEQRRNFLIDRFMY